MAGPSPMALGPYAFRALGFGFTDQQRNIETPWADVPVTDRFDAQHWTGPKSETFTIRGVIFDVEFGGQESLDGIRSSAQAGRPLMLVTMAGRVHGLHAVQGVSEDRSLILANGRPRRNAYQIELRRYTGNGLAGVLASLF